MESFCAICRVGRGSHRLRLRLRLWLQLWLRLRLWLGVRFGSGSGWVRRSLAEVRLVDVCALDFMMASICVYKHKTIYEREKIEKVYTNRKRFFMLPASQGDCMLYKRPQTECATVKVQYILPVIAIDYCTCTSSLSLLLSLFSSSLLWLHLPQCIETN